MQSSYTKGKSWGQAASLLNEQGWSFNDPAVAKQIKKDYPALATAWKARYGKYIFKSSYWFLIPMAGLMAFLLFRTVRDK